MRIHANEESQAPKRRKNTPGESKTKGKEILSQPSEKKQKPGAPLSPLSFSSIKEIDMPE